MVRTGHTIPYYIPTRNVRGRWKRLKVLYILASLAVPQLWGGWMRGRGGDMGGKYSQAQLSADVMSNGLKLINRRTNELFFKLFFKLFFLAKACLGCLAAVALSFFILFLKIAKFSLVACFHTELPTTSIAF